MPRPVDSNMLEQLRPSAVWRFFAGLAATPRPSKQEEQIRAHLRTTLEQLNFKYTEDKLGNMVVRVPATSGAEQAPTTVLQAHVDMVCEKNAGTQHDFNTDPIRLLLDEDADGQPIVRADGTTLGADNGIGVALALAAATEPDVVHGPLELLFTVDEEMGMTGANALTPQSFTGRRLINLDSEEDDALYMGCAGGCDTNLTWRLPRTPLGAEKVCRITVNGLRGGHSGGDIHEGRGNANKLLARVLHHARDHGLRMIHLEGGSKRNAIPREAQAVVAGSAAAIAALQQGAEKVAEQARTESFESGVAIAVAPADQPSAGAASAADTLRLVTALTAIPSGVLGMHPRVPELVQTSNNFSTLSTDEAGSDLIMTAGLLARSSSGSRMDEALDLIGSVGRLAGAEVTHSNRYPGWEPNPDSPLLGVCRRVYEDLFGAAPQVAAIHAGLECGIIGQRVGDMDMVSMGPRIEGAHSPDECVWVASVEKSWTLLKAVLATLAKT